MKILVKSLIVWVLLLAVPFQGFASATMLFCAPMQSAALLKPAMAVAPAGMAMHDHQAMLTMQLAAGDEQAQPGDGAHMSHLAPTHHAGHDGHHDGKCNACAACCFGAAMPPPAAVPVPVDTQQFAAAPFTTGFVPVVELALPERPPQASLS